MGNFHSIVELDRFVTTPVRAKKRPNFTTYKHSSIIKYNWHSTMEEVFQASCLSCQIILGLNRYADDVWPSRGHAAIGEGLTSKTPG